MPCEGVVSRTMLYSICPYVCGLKHGTIVILSISMLSMLYSKAALMVHRELWLPMSWF